MPGERKRVAEVLSQLGITNTFRLKTVGFSDLARGNGRFVVIKDWTPNPVADEVKRRLRELGFCVQFEGKGFVS